MENSIRTIVIKDFSNICRFCLRQNVELKSLFDKQQRQLQLQVQLQNCEAVIENDNIKIEERNDIKDITEIINLCTGLQVNLFIYYNN